MSVSSRQMGLLAAGSAFFLPAAAAVSANIHRKSVERPKQWLAVGGFQHAVPPGARTNSFLNLLICEDRESYSLDVLKRNERREIKRAAEAFTVSLMTDVERIRNPGLFRFTGRFTKEQNTNTSPSGDTKRISQNGRNRCFSIRRSSCLVPTTRIANSAPLASGIWCEDTLIYSIFFCETESLKMHVPGLMLHVMREAAAGCPAIRQIYIGNYQILRGGGRG